MRRSKEDAAKTRERAVRAAAKLFRARGFDGVGLKEIMRAIGMTHGGFYRHFSSKTQLMAEAIASASRDSVESASRAAVPEERRLRAFIDGYLSMEHVAHADRGCPLAALASEAARQPPQARKAFHAAIEAALGGIANGVATGSKRRTRAIQTLASLVGAVVLARAAGDPSLANEIVEATREDLLARADR